MRKGVRFRLLPPPNREPNTYAESGIPTDEWDIYASWESTKRLTTMPTSKARPRCRRLQRRHIAAVRQSFDEEELTSYEAVS
jgi:hypothetical protein